MSPDAARSAVDAAPLPALRLRRGEDRRLRAGHLWVFSNEVDTARTPLTALAPGAIVQVLSDRGDFIGYADVNPHALICARLLSRDPARPPDAALFEARLRRALALRERLFDAPYYRLVFGEGDELPGLVIDRFGDVIVGQIATAGMEARKDLIATVTREVTGARSFVWKNDSAARDLEQLPHECVASFGEIPERLEVRERRLVFEAPLREGQKTGWYYDQAANRARLAALLPPRARVLDVCAYGGAWAVAALAAGAASAACVDASATALESASRNAERNGFALEALHGDAFDVLEALATAGRSFDAIVLDPPAFAKRRRDLPKAEAAYRKLNQLALRLIADDGLLVSCSCSWHLAPDALLGAIQGAARQARRFVQVLEFGGQSPDHPVHPAIPETRYLKAFFCRVVNG